MAENSDGSMQQPIGNRRSVLDTAALLESANTFSQSKLPRHLTSSKPKNNPPGSNGSFLTLSMSERSQGPSVILTKEQKSLTLPPKVSPKPKIDSYHSKVYHRTDRTSSTSGLSLEPVVSPTNEQNLPPKVLPRPTIDSYHSKVHHRTDRTSSTSGLSPEPVSPTNEQNLPPKVSPRPKTRSSLFLASSEQSQELLLSPTNDQNLLPKVSPRPRTRSSSFLTPTTPEQSQGRPVSLNIEKRLQYLPPKVSPKPKFGSHDSETCHSSFLIPSTSKQNKGPIVSLTNEQRFPRPSVPPKVTLRQHSPSRPKVAPRPKSRPVSTLVIENRKKKKKTFPKFFGRLNPSTLMSRLISHVLGEMQKDQPMLEGDEDNTRLFEEDFADSFETTAEALAKRLVQFSDCIAEGLSVPKEHLQQILKQLRKKRILISVLGRHNTGKSTFLNVLVANELLPMDASSETSVKVNVKHNNGVHRRPCPEQLNDPKASCKACPFIIEQNDNGRRKHHGAYNIKLALKQINSDVRSSGKNFKVTAEYEVHGCVSCISEAATPPDWSVLLVDTPGFGEGNQEEIMKEAEASLTTSSAYVYIMTYSHLDDAKDVAALKLIYWKDKDVFKKNRLLVVVTYFDDYYQALDDCFDEDRDSLITSDDVKRKVKELTLVATKGACNIPEENIVPICGQWALFAKKLYYEPQNTELQNIAKECLSMYPGPTTNGTDIATKLEEASDIRVVEERIKEMAQSSFESWVESTKNTFDGFLRQACQKFDGIAQSLEEFANGEEEDYKLCKEQQVDLDLKRKEFTDALSGETSEFYRKLSEVYPKDTEKPIEEWKKVVQDKMDSFEKACVASCKDDYQPEQFQNDVDDFLEKALGSLRSTLEKTYHFSSINMFLHDQMDLQADRFTRLKAVATDFLGVQMVSTSTGEKETGASEETIESIMKKNPANLEELTKEVQIPYVKDSYWKCILIENPQTRPLSKKWLRKITAIWNFLIRRPQGAGLRVEELKKPLNDLKEHLGNECSRYFKETKPPILKYFYGVFHRRANKFLRAFDREFMDRILSRKKELTEEKRKIDGYREEVRTLNAWSSHLDMVGRHLFRKAEECLKQLKNSNKGAGISKAPEEAPNSNESARAVKEDTSVTTSVFYTSLQEGTEGVETSVAKMNSLPEPAIITVHVKGQIIKVPVDEQTSIMGVLEGTLQAHGLTPEESSIYRGDEEVDNETMSSELAGNVLFVQDKATFADIDEELPSGSKSQRTRSGALVNEDQAVAYDDHPNPGPRSSTTWGGRKQHIEDSEISDLVCSISTSKHRAKKDARIGGAVARLLKRMLSSSTGTDQILPGMPTNFESDFKDDLMSTCEVVKARLEELQSQQQVLNLVSAELVHDWKQAEEKNISIAVMGNYNSGKSLLLNALAGQRMLPVSVTKQTMVKVKLQYDTSLHHPKDILPHSESEHCEKCPRLIKGPSELSRGTNNISDTLRLTNKSLRTGALQETDEYFIHANIPILSYVPKPWQVHLVDNPGFMELTEVEAERQFKNEVMALSAYIYTTSYNELQDAFSGAAFKLISDQDQAKAALLENRLVIVVTHFDRYYTALSKEGMLDEKQVKELVCTSIKNATSRTFPKESVIPVCSQWAVIARQLIRQPEDEKHKQKALNCLQLCSDVRVSVGEGSSFSIAQKLEKASGVKHLETRIIQMSQKAYVESVLTITSNFSAYLGAAVKKLRSYTERCGELVQDYIQKQEMATTYKERIAGNKEEMNRLISRIESPAYDDLQSHCDEDMQGILKILRSKSKELQEMFKQDCAAKISAKEIGPPEFEEGVGQLVQDTLEAIQLLWNDMEFENTSRCFDQRVKEVNEKYEEMRQDAHIFSAGGVPEHKEDVCVDMDAIQNALKKMPPTLYLQELKKRVDIPSTGGLFRKEKNYTRLEQLLKSFNQFEKVMDENLSTYIDKMRPKLMELLYGNFCDHVKKQQEDFDEEFSRKMETREMEMEEIMKVKMAHEDEAKRLDMWSNHLEKLQKHLERKSEEILKQS